MADTEKDLKQEEQATTPAEQDAAKEKETEQPKKKKGLPVGVRILLWLGIIALVIFLTLFIVSRIVPDERINTIPDLVNYLITEFQAL